MLSATLGLSIFMLIATIVGMAYMLKRLKLINFFNLSIFMTLAVFWVAVRLFNEQFVYNLTGINNDFVFAFIIGGISFIQVIFRPILGTLSRKIRSRKVPIILAFSVFLVFAIPFLVVQNTISFVFLGFGVGAFTATFGMENLYFSENWSVKHVFITVALVSFLPTTGVFVANIIHSSSLLNHLTDNDYRQVVIYTLLGILCFATIILSLYVLFNHEHKNTIAKDVVSNQNVIVASFKYKDLMKMSLVIFFIGFANQLIFRQGVSRIEDENTWTFMYVLITGFSIITALLTSLVLVKYFSMSIITKSALGFTLIGITLGVVMWFANIRSVYIGAIFIFVFATAVTMYETTLIGTMVHFDHKNKMLVLTWWLTIRSLGYGLGDTIGGSLESKLNLTNDDVSKWIVFGGFVLVLCAAASTFIGLRARTYLYKNVDISENKCYTDKLFKESIWK